MDNTNCNKIPAVEPWSLIPILCLIFGLISIIGIIFLVRYFDKKKNEKAMNIMILIYGLLFVVLEIYHEINRGLTLGFYDWSSFPFQFCSIPIYMCPILPFIKNEKVKTVCYYYLGTFCLISGIFPLFFGQGQLCRWPNPWDTARSFLWHILIVHVAIISIVHKKIGFYLKNDYKYLLGAIGLFVSFTVIAQLINVTLHYTGGINYPIPEGSEYKDVDNTKLCDPDIASCFYISPFFVSNMPVYGTIYRTCGWIVNYIAYVLSFSLGGALVFFSSVGVFKLINKAETKIEERKNNE